MANLAGIDVGLTLLKKTSGVCRTGEAGVLVAHTYIDKLSRLNALVPVQQFDMLAIDGPVLPAGTLHYDRRVCETAFVTGAFQRRCKPGLSHVAGTGQALRRAGCDTAAQFAAETTGEAAVTDLPRIQQGRNIIEAFPNAFLGVLLPDGSYVAQPKLKRGAKFGWLLEKCRESQALERLKEMIGWDAPALWEGLRTNGHHEEQAGIVCAVTAVCAWQGKYVAVGEPAGGYFFLPPWTLWQDWAKSALKASRRRVQPALDVWVDGTRYGRGDQLP